MRAIDIIKEQYISEQELADFLNVDTKRIRDLRSHHITGKREFINHIKPTGKCILYRVQDVLDWLDASNSYSFGSSKECSDSDEESETYMINDNF